MATRDHEAIHAELVQVREQLAQTRQEKTYLLEQQGRDLSGKIRELEAQLTQAEAVVEAAEHIQICPASCNYEGHIEELICKRAWEKLEDALTAFRQGRGGG